MKRTFLFIMTNLAVMAVLSVVMNIVFAVTGTSKSGFGGILIIATLFGFGGSIVSLLLSKRIALKSVGGGVIEHPANEQERWILQTLEKQAKQLGIGVPDVAIYQAPDMNAFATGAKKNSALVALSTGLLNKMDRDEVEAVIAHEMSHIANGDMITMTLMQGVINTFVIFASRIIAREIASRLNRGLGTIAYFAVSIILELTLGFLASFITMWFSRRREFFADSGAAELVGKDKMIAALQRLKGSHEPELDGSLMAFGINGKGTIMQLLMSHPPLDKRIEALRNI